MSRPKKSTHYVYLEADPVGDGGHAAVRFGIVGSKGDGYHELGTMLLESEGLEMLVSHLRISTGALSKDRSCDDIVLAVAGEHPVVKALLDSPCCIDARGGNPFRSH